MRAGGLCERGAVACCGAREESTAGLRAESLALSARRMQCVRAEGHSELSPVST